MAILAGAIIKIVARHKTLRTWQRGSCLHIAVSDGASLYNFFNTDGNATSHFYVRKSGNTNGMADFEQYVDTKYRAPAQLEGNPTLISLETQGGVGSDLNVGWTATQLERIAWILAQCNKIHGTPLVAMPNSRPESVGVGYHRLGVDPYRISGGELWSSAYGKVCPGSARMAQIPSIITRARQLAGSVEDDMVTPNDVVGLNTDGSPMTMGQLSARDNYVYGSILEGGKVDIALDELRANVASIQAALGTTGVEGLRYAALQNTLDDFIAVMQGRYIRAEAIHDEDQAAVAGLLTPLQVLAAHEDVDDALVQAKLDALAAAVALLPKV